MKKFPSILFVFSLLFMLTACSSSADPSQESSGQTTSPSSQQDSVSVSNAVLESESTESEQSANNTLIVYFSRWGNTEYPSDVDAITSASIVVDNNSRYGTTEYVANMIAENVGGDLHRIETVTPYTADFDELRDVNHDEMSRNYLPELKESNLDISAYDTVFTVSIMTFLAVWNNFIFPSVLNQSKSARTVTIALTMFETETYTPWHIISAAAIIASVPLIIVVLLLQKRIVSGMIEGGVKG